MRLVVGKNRSENSEKIPSVNNSNKLLKKMLSCGNKFAFIPALYYICGLKKEAG